MRSISSFLWTLFMIAVIVIAAWMLGLGRVLHLSIPPGHLLDWGTGAVCFLWLLIVLKAPWDLYFQAHEVAFELQRSQERKVAVTAGREEYIHSLRRRLLALAVGAHLLSALLIAVVTYFAGGMVGYYFAGFYLVSTVFRPAVAGYVYLSDKLRSIGQEVRYPREDVEEIRQKLQWLEHDAVSGEDNRPTAIYTQLGTLPKRVDEIIKQIGSESEERKVETQQLRQQVHAMSREFELTISRLTDNQEVIKGIQAFVRLVSQATQS